MLLTLLVSRPDGNHQMVGKIINPPELLGAPVFYHLSSDSQWHRNFDSPGGVDEVVLDFLARCDIHAIHHEFRSPRDSRNGLYMTDVEAVIAYGIPEYSDGRYRVYLPASMWDRRDSPPYKVQYAKAEKLLISHHVDFYGSSVDDGVIVLP